MFLDFCWRDLMLIGLLRMRFFGWLIGSAVICGWIGWGDVTWAEEPLTRTGESVSELSSVDVDEKKAASKAHDPLGGARYRVLRVPLSDVGASDVPTDAKSIQEHPMLPALRYAYERYEVMRDRVHSYRGKLVMRERIQGKLKLREFMEFKIRHRQVEDGVRSVPFSVYLNYLAPKTIKGREVLYVEGQNEGKLVATRGGGKALNDVTLRLVPDGPRAMRRAHYPVTDFGMLNLARRLIEYGTDEMESEASWDAKVRFASGAKINKRPCVMIEVVHPQRREGLRYHVARIFVDQEHEVPVRYAAYTWPEEGADTPRLMEEYTYIDLELNVEFAAAEFDATNSNYRFREARPQDDPAGSEQEAAQSLANNLPEATSDEAESAP